MLVNFSKFYNEKAAEMASQASLVVKAHAFPTNAVLVPLVKLAAWVGTDRTQRGCLGLHFRG